MYYKIPFGWVHKQKNHISEWNRFHFCFFFFQHENSNWTIQQSKRGTLSTRESDLWSEGIIQTLVSYLLLLLHFFSLVKSLLWNIRDKVSFHCIILYHCSTSINKILFQALLLSKSITIQLVARINLLIQGEVIVPPLQ